MAFQLIPFITMALTVAATTYSIYSSEQARSQQNKIADANAERARAESEETARRAEMQAERVNSAARARAAASGVTGLSSELYLSELRTIQQEEIDWIRLSGMSQANIAKLGGKYASGKAKADQVSQLFSGLDKGFKIADEANWIN